LVLSRQGRGNQAKESVGGSYARRSRERRLVNILPSRERKLEIRERI